MQSSNDEAVRAIGGNFAPPVDAIAEIQLIIDRKYGKGNATASLDADGVTVLVGIHAGAPTTVTRGGINKAIAGFMEHGERRIPKVYRPEKAKADTRYDRRQEKGKTKRPPAGERRRKRN